MLVFTVTNALFGIVGVVLYGELSNLIFLLPLLIAVVVIYTIWLLVRRYPRMFREYVLFFGLIFGSLLLYLLTFAPCSGTQLCLDFGPLVAFGVFLLIVFLLSLWYLARVRLIERNTTKRTKK
jgi:xanthine/uracil permease